MGAWYSLSINGVGLWWGKNEVDPVVLSLFADTDKVRQSVQDGDGETLELYSYAASVREIIDRLEVMSFDLVSARSDYKREHGSFVSNYLDCLDEPIGLDGFTFEQWMAQFRVVFDLQIDLASTSKLRDFGLDALANAVDATRLHEVGWVGFFASDPRYEWRAAMDLVPADATVRLEYSDLVHSGYVHADCSLDELSHSSAATIALARPKVILMAEGTTDLIILRKSLRALYPHLCPYYSFLELDALNLPGGASRLTTIVKSMAAAGINNRIAALFDSDTAAAEALASLDGTGLPENIKVIRLPYAPWASSYPTIGPQGDNISVDVNGKACSIEMYLGQDLLLSDNGSLRPVQWMGYNQKLKAYQGEIIDKKAVFTAFISRIDAVLAEPSRVAEFDFEGIRLVMQTIFKAFPGSSARDSCS